MEKNVREPSLIELEYITKVLTDDNVNVEKVIVHSVTERKNCTEYSVEVHHDEQCTIFNGTKEKIDEIILRQKEYTAEEINEIIKKAANDCALMYKYSTNIIPFIVDCGIFTFVVRNQSVSLMKTSAGADKDYYLKTRPSLLFSGFFEIAIKSSSNYNKLDRIYDKSIRLTHDSTEFNYSSGNKNNIDIEYFHEPNKGDYFSFSTISSLDKESYENLCSLYEVLESIKYTEYKIKFEDDNRMQSTNKSNFRKSIKEYLKLDLEKEILDEIEREYADYIKVP